MNAPRSIHFHFFFLPTSVLCIPPSLLVSLLAISIFHDNRATENKLCTFIPKPEQWETKRKAVEEMWAAHSPTKGTRTEWGGGESTLSYCEPATRDVKKITKLNKLRKHSNELDQLGRAMIFHLILSAILIQLDPFWASEHSWRGQAKRFQPSDNEDLCAHCVISHSADIRRCWYASHFIPFLKRPSAERQNKHTHDSEVWLLSLSLHAEIFHYSSLAFIILDGSSCHGCEHNLHLVLFRL